MKRSSFLTLVLVFFAFVTHSQMRQVYVDADGDNSIRKISFYSPSEGYVAFQKWIGYTTDSGRTFTKRYITFDNVNFGAYSDVNLTFGFEINGVVAIDRNTLVVYGDYGIVPAILYSSDGGNHFTLVFLSQYNPLQLRTGVTDMVFPQHDNIGFAVDADRILKTTDKGLTWSVLTTAWAGSYFDHIDGSDNNNLTVLSTNFTTNRLVKTSDGGAHWSQVFPPTHYQGYIGAAYFLNANLGWISMSDEPGNRYFYRTADGGTTWTQLNDLDATPFNCDLMRFTDANTGYAILLAYEVYKTTNGGTTWEPLPRDNNYSYLGYTNYDLQVLSPTQLWAGGGHGFLQLSANGGGTPLPAPYFHIDTTGVYFTNTVNLKNFSRSGYQTQWLVNGTPVSTSYNGSYTHDVHRKADTIQLVNSSAGITDTLTRIQYFFVPVFPKPASFYPATGSTGTFVTIRGSGFAAVNGVSFGNIAAASFAVTSDTTITAVVAAGASGNITLQDFHGSYPLPGFTYFAPPAVAPPFITDFSPISAPVDSLVTINGSGFNATSTQNGVFFGGIAAAIRSATTNSIVCTVPRGAVMATITVLNKGNGLTGESPLAFRIPFADSVGNFTPNSFTPAWSTTYVEYSVPWGVQGKDLDGDGKPDLLGLLQYSNDSLMVYRNISSSGHIRFAPPLSLGSIFWGASPGFGAADLDGDGRPDVVNVTNDQNVLVYHNTSSPGTLRFDQVLTVPVAPASQSVVLTDLDNDGRPDIASACFNSSIVSVVRNTSSPGFLSFGTMQNLPAGGTPNGIAAGDLDGDGLRDIVSFDAIYDGTPGEHPGNSNISCYRNTSIRGNLSFATVSTITVPSYNLAGNKIAIVDYDGDGKPDIVVPADQYLFVLRNLSIPGHFSFAPPVSVSLGNSGAEGVIANFSGSTRPDVAIGGSARNYLLFRNSSTPGVVGIDSLIYGTSGNFIAQHAGVADFDQDGRPDLATASPSDYGLNVLRNMAGIPIKVQMCTTSPYNRELASDLRGSSYRWQVDTGTGFGNLTDNVNVSGSASGSLLFLMPPIAWQGYKYRCVVDGRYSSSYQLQLDAVIDPGVVLTATDSVICNGANITFSAADTNDNTMIVCRFQLNGQYVVPSSVNTYSSYSLHDGDQVRAILFWSDACQGIHYDTSRSITVHVTQTPDTVRLTASATNVCVGTPVTFTASPTGGGASPTYTWLVNGAVQSATGPGFTTGTLSNSSQIQVKMNSSAACPYPLVATSNILAMTITDTNRLGATIGVNTSGICAGSPITFTAQAYNPGPVTTYQWLVNGADSGVNSATFVSSGLHNNDIVQVVITSPSSCRTGNVVTSDPVIVPINATVTPAVSISKLDSASCAGSPVSFQANVVNGGTYPTLQWNKNNLATGATGTTYTSDDLNNGDVITVTLHSGSLCASPQTVTSMPVAVTIGVSPLVQIAGDTSVSPGVAVAVSATVGNAIAAVSYQWQDSTILHSWQNINGAVNTTLSYLPVTSGDAIRCVALSAAGCKGVSKALSIKIKKPTAGTAAPITFRQYPNPATTTLTIDNLTPADGFTALAIFSGSGNKVLEITNVNSSTHLVIDVAGLNPGEYYAELTRQSGKKERFLFLKL